MVCRAGDQCERLLLLGLVTSTFRDVHGATVHIMAIWPWSEADAHWLQMKQAQRSGHTGAQPAHEFIHSSIQMFSEPILSASAMLDAWDAAINEQGMIFFKDKLVKISKERRLRRSLLSLQAGRMACSFLASVRPSIPPINPPTCTGCFKPRPVVGHACSNIEDRGSSQVGTLGSLHAVPGSQKKKIFLIK